MVQLAVEQRTFIMKTFFDTRRLQRTCETFRERFQERQPPALKTIWANVREFSQHGTTLNRNKVNSGRSRTGLSEANIEAAKQRLAEHPTGTSGRRNDVGLTSATFNKITRLDLIMHPYRMQIRHQLLPRDSARRMQFPRWLRDHYKRNEDFLRPLVIEDEAAFAMNG